MKRIPTSSRNRRTWLRSIVSLSVVAIFAMACSGNEEHPLSVGGGTGAVATGPCTEGAQQECGVVLKQGEGIVTCYRGTQYCEDGTWGECTDGEVTKEPDPKSGQYRNFREIQVLSGETPQDCMQACDPNCLQYVETPPGFTGGTPIVTPNFPGGNPCAHGLCEEGVALNATCDPCVATVCAADPTCCSGSWDGACVDQTYTLCANQPPPLGLCDFGVFAETTVTTSNRPSSGAAIGGNGDIEIGTDASPSMIVAGGNLTIKSPNGASVDTPGGVWAGGNIVVQAGGATTYNGNWNAGGEIYLNGGNTINGDVWAGSTGGQNIDGQLSAVITGNATAGGVVTPNVQAGVSGLVTEGSTHDPPVIDLPSSIPTRAASCPGTDGNVNLGGGATTTIGPGDYGTWTMNNGNNVISLAPGTYTLNQLTAAGANPGSPNVIRLDGTATDRWDITVCSNSSVQNWFEIQDNSGARLTNPVQLVMYFDGNLTAGTDSYFSGVFMVPNGSFTSGDRSQINGAIWANSINAGTDLNAVPMDKAACESLGFTTPPITTCPVDPSTPPAINEPCESGSDCQINTRCDEVLTNAACTHSKCKAGDALGSSCDDCVSRICAVDPTCCDSSAGDWSWSCVDMVATVCDANCGAIPAPYCAQDLCEEGIYIQTGCHACSDTICSNPTYAYCCDSADPRGWDATCVNEVYNQCGTGVPVVPGSGETVCDYGLLAQGTATLYGSRVLGGDIGGGTGSISLNANWGVRSRVEGDVWSRGSLNFFDSDVAVDANSEGGDVWVVGSYSKSNYTVAGREPAGSPGGDTVPSASIPTRSPTCPTGGSASSSSSNRTLAPGTYGAVTQGGWGSTLTLQAGTYYMNSLEMQGGTTLAMPASGTVEIIVCGNITFQNDTRVTGISAGTDLFRAQFYSHAGNISVGSSAILYGMFTAPAASPNGTLTMMPDATIYGAVWTGNAATLGNGGARSTIDASSYTRDECIAAGLDPVFTPASCPVVTPGVPDPAETGSCISNLDGWTDAFCGGYDLAIDFPCDDDLPVCNHGTTDFSGTVEVGFWVDTDSQMSEPNPDISAMDGTCSALLNITAGTCTTMTCVVPAGTHTLMVDPNASLSECNTNRLDNWSWDDGSSCSSSGGTVEFEYEADCPDDTSARWKDLTWDSSTPVGSSIDFSVKVAGSLADLSSESYTFVGTAEAAAPDTQVCNLAGPSPECPVKLTDELGLGQNQGQFLSLRAASTGSPTLNDWTLSYTCVFDQ